MRLITRYEYWTLEGCLPPVARALAIEDQERERLLRQAYRRWAWGLVGLVVVGIVVNHFVDKGRVM